MSLKLELLMCSIDVQEDEISFDTDLIQSVCALLCW